MKLLRRIRALFNFKGQRAEMELESAEVRGSKVFLHPVDDPDHTFCISGKAIDIVIEPTTSLTEGDIMVLDNRKLSKLEPAIENESTAAIENLLQPKVSANQQSPSLQDSVMRSSAKKTDSTACDCLKTDTRAKPKEETLSSSGASVVAALSDKQESEQSVDRKPNVTGSYELPKMHTVTMKLYPEEYEMLMSALEEKGYRKTEFLLACVAAAKKNSMESNYQKYYAQRLRRRKERREAAKRAMGEGQSV